jgi:hypothetical protein
MERASRISNAASVPEHPAAFRLTGRSLPLAGLDDTYWIARAVWMDGESNDEGFLIYADARHYLFLDEEEAHTAALLLSGQYPPHLARPHALLKFFGVAAWLRLWEVRPGRARQRARN